MSVIQGCFSVGLKTGSKPSDINRFRSHKEKYLFISQDHLFYQVKRSDKRPVTSNEEDLLLLKIICER